MQKRWRASGAPMTARSPGRGRREAVRAVFCAASQFATIIYSTPISPLVIGQSMYLTAPFVLRSQLFRFTRKHGIFSLKVISELPTRRHKIQTSNDHLGSQWSAGILRVKRQHRRLLRKMQISVNLRPNSQIGYIFSVTWIVPDLAPVAIHKIAFFPRGDQIRNPINQRFIGFLTDLLYSVRSSTRTWT